MQHRIRISAASVITKCTSAPLCPVLMLVAAALLSGALPSSAHAQAPDQRWATQFGTSERDVVWSIAPDGTGGVMVAGHTEGSLFGPHAGANDAIVARYDAVGNKLWGHQFGTSEWDFAMALAPDGAGGVMVAGITSGSLGGPSAGGEDAYIARYDTSGTRLWIRQFGTSGLDEAIALAPDGAGGVFIAGWTKGSLGGASAGSDDAFVARYDANGIQLWIRQFGSRNGGNARALTPDGAGGVFIAGFTSGNLGGANMGKHDAFVARDDANGTQLWVRQYGTDESDYADALARDGAGGVFVAGNTSGSLGGPSAGNSDAYVAQYDASGNQLWIHQFGTGSWDSARGLAPDGAGGVMVAGGTSGSLGGPSAGGYDAFVARYDASGTQLWIHQFGTSGYDLASALAPDGAGGVMVAGETSGSLGGPNAGEYDAFIARFVPCYADLDASTGAGTLDIFDFLAFQSGFVNGNLAACDCDTSSGWLVCDIFDFLCFQDAFVAGCP